MCLVNECDGQLKFPQNGDVASGPSSQLATQIVQCSRLSFFRICFACLPMKPIASDLCRETVGGEISFKKTNNFKKLHRSVPGSRGESTQPIN